MQLHSVHRIAPISGYGLNTEEISGLEVGMLQRKLQENLVGGIYFWGKIFGTTQDYLIVHNIDPFADFPDKKFYFWYDMYVFNISILYLLNPLHI
jgi:hypothetical protein